MQRIAVVGTTGSGKTTLARQLAQRLGLPFVEEDALAWEPNWTEAPREVVRKRIADALSGETWVVDGDMLWSGNRERWWVAFFSRESLLWYALRTFKARRRAYAAIFAQPEYAHLTVVRLRSPRAARAWVSDITEPGLSPESWQSPPGD